jgi:putative hemolysin
MFSSSKDNLKLQDKQKEMLEDALEFSELVAKNVMVPRTEVVAVESSTPLPEVIELAKEEGYTRFPVYSDNIDHIEGILIIYDLLTCDDKEKHTAGEFVRESLYVPETMDLDAVLKEMQNQKKSLAIVVDSYGGTAGIVTTEDILEEIVGEIEDEYDSPEDPDVLKIGDDHYMVFGYVDVDTLNDEYEMDLPEGDYETIAGLIIDHLEKIPTKDQEFVVQSWNFKISKVSNRKIEKIELKKRV